MDCLVARHMATQEEAVCIGRRALGRAGAIAVRILRQILLVILGAEGVLCTETTRLERRGPATGRLSVDVGVDPTVDLLGILSHQGQHTDVAIPVVPDVSTSLAPSPHLLVLCLRSAEPWDVSRSNSRECVGQGTCNCNC